MSRIPYSIDIILGENQESISGRKTILTPLSSGEAWIAGRGLDSSISERYNKLEHEAGVFAVYNFLFDKVDKYRFRSYNLAKDLTAPIEDVGSRAVPAAAVAQLLFASRVQKSGKWPKTSEQRLLLKQTFEEVHTADELAFDALVRWAIPRAVGNRVYWDQQLLANRGHQVIDFLRIAIDESDHYQVEV